MDISLDKSYNGTDIELVLYIDNIRIVKYLSLTGLYIKTSQFSMWTVLRVEPSPLYPKDKNKLKFEVI